MKGIKKITIAFFAIALVYLVSLVYSIEKDRQDAYEKGMKENQQLSTLNAMDQLKLAVKLYVITNNTYPEILIDDLVNGEFLNEQAISLKDEFSIDKNKLNITYNKSFDCRFMFKNLNDYIHLKVKNDILHCEEKTLTFSIKDRQS